MFFCSTGVSFLKRSIFWTHVFAVSDQKISWLTLDVWQFEICARRGKLQKLATNWSQRLQKLQRLGAPALQTFKVANRITKAPGDRQWSGRPGRPPIARCDHQLHACCLPRQSPQTVHEEHAGASPRSRRQATPQTCSIHWSPSPPRLCASWGRHSWLSLLLAREDVRLISLTSHNVIAKNKVVKNRWEVNYQHIFSNSSQKTPSSFRLACAAALAWRCRCANKRSGFFASHALAFITRSRFKSKTRRNQ